MWHGNGAGSANAPRAIKVNRGVVVGAGPRQAWAPTANLDGVAVRQGLQVPAHGGVELVHVQRPGGVVVLMGGCGFFLGLGGGGVPRVAHTLGRLVSERGGGGLDSPLPQCKKKKQCKKL